MLPRDRTGEHHQRSDTSDKADTSEGRFVLAIPVKLRYPDYPPMFEQVIEPTVKRFESVPRHSRAKHFQALGLVKDVRSFSEFESRVTSLPTEQARGAAFEVFAEACLATQRIYQAREVWPESSLPSALRQQLRLPFMDMGVDGVFVTAAGDPVCYQSKFRIGRPAL
ncbi:MAG: hypothetical protein INR62_13590, partial [Rhodospirillales bacterium]|nr:hypothetical protein [Acetobacter sp.]